MTTEQPFPLIKRPIITPAPIVSIERHVMVCHEGAEFTVWNARKTPVTYARSWT